jgi:hypothetical protein
MSSMGPTADFKWDGDDADSVILPYQPRTAVYSTRGGGICIRQERDAYEEDDPQLLLTPQGALAVAWALIEEAHLTGLPTPSLSLMVESEHWPPIHRRGEPPAPAGPVVEPAQAEGEPGPLLKAMQETAQ